MSCLFLVRALGESMMTRACDVIEISIRIRFVDWSCEKEFAACELLAQFREIATWDVKMISSKQLEDALNN